MFKRNDLYFPQQEIIVTRNTNRDSWVGQCEIFNKNPYECVGVMVRQLDRNYHYNYRLVEGSSFLLQPSGNLKDFHCFKFMVVFNDDKGSPVGDIDKVMKGADREEIERKVEKGHSMLLEDLCVYYGNLMNTTDWKARLEKFAPYKASIRVRIPSLPFCKRRTILIPEVGTQNHRVNESNDILQDAGDSHQDELDQSDQQIRRVLRIKKFTDFEIRAQKLFRNFINPSEPYKAEHAEVFPNRYIQFKRETRIQLKKGKRSYNPWIGEVTIRNHAPSHYLIYKLRTTAPQHYVVMPTEGVLMPRFRRKMFSLKYQTSKFTDTLEHLNKTIGLNATATSSNNLLNASAAFGDDAQSDMESNSRLEQIQQDIMMDKKFMRSSINRSAPQNKVRCENHRFADTQNFASLARDILNNKEHEEQADSVSIRFLYSDVIAEVEALNVTGTESAFGGRASKRKQYWPQGHQQQRDSQVSPQQQQRLSSQLPLQEQHHSMPVAGYAKARHANQASSNDLFNRSSYMDATFESSNNINNVDSQRMRSSSTSDAVGKQSNLDGLYSSTEGIVLQGDTASGDTSRSSTELSKLLVGGGTEEAGGATNTQTKIKAQKRKDLATWMKMTSTERSAEVKDEKNHVQSHVFLLDIAFVDPYAVDERNYNIEELFRHTETLTGGYKMSRCFYPYFVPEDTISGPVIVYPKNDVVIDRGIGSAHIHWLTEIYLVNIYKSSLYYCIIPQEEDYGQLEVGDEILVTPKSGHLLHYSEKKRFCGLFESNMSDSLCEQIQIYLRYTRTCFMEDGPIFKLHIFFFTESSAPDWLKDSSQAENVDVTNPAYCNPLSRALDVVTVRIFIKDAEHQVTAKNTLNYDDLDDTEDVFRPLKSDNGQWSDPPAKDMHTLIGLQETSRKNVHRVSMLRNSAQRIQDTYATRGFGELLHQASHIPTTQHPLPREPIEPLVEFDYPCDKLSMASFVFPPNMFTPAVVLRTTRQKSAQARSSQHLTQQQVEEVEQSISGGNLGPQDKQDKQDKQNKLDKLLDIMEMQDKQSNPESGSP